MIKIFATADNHFGRHYDKHPVRESIIAHRMSAFKNMITEANNRYCQIFSIGGDLFDRTDNIEKPLVQEVVKALSEFSGLVLVLPGNHDYYDETVQVWKDFEEASAPYNNIVLLKEFREYVFDVDCQQVAVYPAFCQSKHSHENNLGWIKALDLPCDYTYRIGMAHGALEGLSPDEENRYFGMTKEELEAIPMDCWLLGHTHMPYPETVPEDTFIDGHKIFNPGTHAQTDIGNRTEGYCFEICIGEDKKAWAKKFKSGNLFFYRETVNVDPDIGLRESIANAINDYPQNSIVELILKGSIPRKEYETRADVYDEFAQRFLWFKATDTDLSEQITEEFIKDTFAETSLPAKVLLRLVGEPKEAQMLYELLEICKE